MRIYRNGDRCPCCGQVLQGKDEEWLRLFSLLVDAQGLPPWEAYRDNKNNVRAVEDIGPYERNEQGG